MLIHFVDREFEFVDIPMIVNDWDKILRIVIVVGVIGIIDIIGILMINSVMIGE